MVLLTLLPLVLLGVTANVNAHGVIKNCTVNGVK